MSERVLVDVNAAAIRLVDDHPGHSYVTEAVRSSLAGADTLLVFGYLPLRIQWVLEDMGFKTVAARNALSSFLQYPMEFVPVDDETILTAYEISATTGHDVYDSFYLALARAGDADRFVTTDRDFEALCAGESVAYDNPVPDDVLEQFHEASS